ncbi:MAG: CooT family nickel-binding protein [Oscillospiraceae bacterium]|nr:CooT family nickel-binding protein [Oscillospiraceae bacterium]
MCLSTVYKNKPEPEAVLMRNVTRIDWKDGCIILTDLMERQLAFEGRLESADLVNGYVIVKETP